MPHFAIPQKEVNGPLQAVPTSLTSLATTDAVIFEMIVRNPTASAITFTMTDGQASPVALFSSYSVPAGTTVNIDSINGIQFTSGVKWQAGGAGLVATYRIKARMTS